MGYYTTNSLIKVRLKMIEMCNGKHKLTRKRRERLKELLGGRTPKSFEVCNILPLDKILNFSTVKDERVCSHPI